MRLAIIGAGGFASETAQWAADYFGISNMGIDGHVGFYVSDEKYLSKNVELLNRLDEWQDAVIGIGSPAVRYDMSKKHKTYGMVIHPTAYIAPGSKIGKGAVLCPYSMISVDCVIGDHYHSNMHSYIGHGCKVGDCVTVSPGARISGDCYIGNRVYIGSNAVVREKTKVCDDAVIGAGAVVLNDITEPGVYVGIPARKK